MRNGQLSDDHIRSRIASMTQAEKLALVEQCERTWAGTEQEWMARMLRKLYESERLQIN
jgi:hypothetical protein